jgi:uncharacterized membrane protein
VRRAGASAIAHRLVWLGWTLLLLQQVTYSAQQNLPWVIWLGALLPLLIFLPGMLRDRLRSYIWLCFVSLLYFIALVERLFARPDALAVTGTVAVVTLFTAAMMYVRWRARELRAAGATETGSGD